MPLILLSKLKSNFDLLKMLKSLLKQYLGHLLPGYWAVGGSERVGEGGEGLVKVMGRLGKF